MFRSVTYIHVCRTKSYTFDFFIRFLINIQKKKILAL